MFSPNGGFMSPQITIILNTKSDLEIGFNQAALQLPEDQFIALIEDSINTLKSQLLLIEQSS
jgi:hypothetical protein